MRAYLIYIQLEFKKAGKILPRFFAGAIVLVAILGTIAFSAEKLIYQDTFVSRITVGVVLPKEDSLAETAIRMLSSLDSVKSVCDFQYISEADGRKAMRKGTLHALMVVPGGFVDDIITGENTPVTIVLPDRPGIEAMVFKELADSGARTLSAAQASIYAADQLYATYQMTGEISRVEEELNRIYFAYALPRADYFRNNPVTATGEVSVLQHYGISAAILFLLLCGIPLAAFCQAEKPVLTRKLEHIGISRWRQVLAKVLAVATLLLVVSGIGWGGLLFLGFLTFRVRAVFLGVLVCFGVAVIIVAVYSVAGDPTAGVMGLFWLTIGMVFLSGGLVPPVFLPDAVRKISALIPTTALMQNLKGLLGVDISPSTVLQSLGWGMVCYLIAVIGRRRG